MQSFVRQSPLRTFKMEEADLIFIAANLSGMCWAGNQFRASSLFRTLWRSLSRTSHKVDTLKAAVLTRVNCPLPWVIGGSFSPVEQSEIAAQTLRVRVLSSAKAAAREIVAPALIASPAWLLGDDGDSSTSPPEVRPWETRPLLLLVGHVPKLYVSPTRYFLWRAWRRDPRVSVYTKDIACALTAHSICRQPSRWASEHMTFCQRDCGTTRACKSGVAAMQRECKFYKLSLIHI